MRPRRGGGGVRRTFLRSRWRSLMTEVYVVGIDMIRFGRYPERAVVDLASEAALLALDDCGIGIKDIKALYSGNIGETMTGQRTLQLIGQTGIPVVNCTNACATGATAFREGWMAIKAGLHDTVLCIGVEKMARGGGRAHVGSQGTRAWPDATGGAGARFGTCERRLVGAQSSDAGRQYRL